jgi:SMC interacting uncharacterized protein involved in chromosome segregation
MSDALIGAVNPFAKEPTVASKETIRKFVKELAEVSDTIKDARSDLKECIDSDEDIQSIDEKIKLLKEERKDLIDGNAAIQGYKGVLDDAMGDKHDLISDAKQDGVPRKEIDLAIKALKGDIDMTVSTEMYANIADLVS